MLRPEIPTLSPPAYVLEETEDQHAGDWRTEDGRTEEGRTEDWRNDERPSAA